MSPKRRSVGQAKPTLPTGCPCCARVRAARAASPRRRCQVFPEAGRTRAPRIFRPRSLGPAEVVPLGDRNLDLLLTQERAGLMPSSERLGLTPSEVLEASSMLNPDVHPLLQLQALAELDRKS